MDWHNNWFFSRNISDKNFSEIPEDAIPFDFNKNGIADMDKINGEGVWGDECIIYHPFELEESRCTSFGTCPDNWLGWYLNGEKVCSLETSGNGNFITADSCVYFIDIPKGKNLLAIHLQRNKNWQFALQELSNPLAPVEVTADPTIISGKIKPMNAVNNGPIKAVKKQSRGNMNLWQEINIPFVRNHDAAFCSIYGGEHTVDIHAIFPDFSKDPDDPDSYMFTPTDRYLATILEGNSKIFYRLGSKIEYNPEKFGTVVPADFKKWAVICEHIIRHYNEGWANGFHWNIEYWEIWNEPDLGTQTWQGTKEQFFELYRIAAIHLKKCFPSLKIGGPALAYNLNWLEDFLKSMTSGEYVPIDFLSWHIYAKLPEQVRHKSCAIRKMLDSYGYNNAESILNEWNYLRCWEAGFLYTIKSIISIKGAVFAASFMSVCQDSPVDMLMYYDARPCAFNGIFDFYTYAPLKTFYVFKIWAKLASLGKQIKVTTSTNLNLYAAGASNGEKCGIMLARFYEQDALPPPVTVNLNIKNADTENTGVYLLDDTCNMTETEFMVLNNKISFQMPANSVIYIEQNISQ